MDPISGGRPKLELRRILKEANVEFGVTMVLVTHDQTEAMAFARQVVVMNHGEVVQAGTPRELFERPATRHVGYFIGSPAMNFLAARREGDAIVSEAGLTLPAPVDVTGDGLMIGFRPEHASLGETGVPGRVERVWFEGLDGVVAVSLGNEGIRVRLDARHPIAVGESVRVSVPGAALRLYAHDRLIA